VSLVFVDGRNVQRSQWPNLSDEQLVERCRAWAERNGHELVLVFDGQALDGLVGEERLDERTTLVGTARESADDWLIRELPNHPGAWLVTSDRALREAAGAEAERLIGGGAFLRLLDSDS
jgi:predicted RNA-binding protein with PIN domain